MRKVPVGFVLVASVLFALGGVAFANNVHKVNGWYHGLGDAKDGDYYVFAFNHNKKDDHKHHNGIGVHYSKNSSTLVEAHAKDADAKRLYLHWDTGQRVECRYVSSNWAAGPHPLNFNYHKHHNYCGSW